MQYSLFDVISSKYHDSSERITQIPTKVYNVVMV